MTIQKLFFQLIQVSLGQLDCLDRGPSSEEWQELYELSKSHRIAAVCYDGVVRLFDFGLRAPQDLSIDWMAETETSGAQSVPTVPAVGSKLRRTLLQRWRNRNGSSLYRRTDKTRLTPAAGIVVLLVRAFEDFHQGTLRLDAVVALSQLLSEAGGELPEFRDGSDVQQVLQTLGIWNFTRAMMWLSGEVAALSPKLMVGRPDASRGQFLLRQVWGEKWSIGDRLRNRLKKLLLF